MVNTKDLLLMDNDKLMDYAYSNHITIHVAVKIFLAFYEKYPCIIDNELLKSKKKNIKLMR